MNTVIFSVVFGIGSLMLISLAFYKALVKKKKLGNMYTPYDDMTRGTNDTNTHMYLEEDTRHAIRIEENQTIE